MKENLIKAYFKTFQPFLTFRIIKAQETCNLLKEEYMKMYLSPQGEDKVVFYCTPKLRKQEGF